MKLFKWDNKLLVYIIMVFLILILLVACDVAADSDEAVTNDEETFTFSYNSTFPPASVDYEAAEYMMEVFVEEVEERSNGRIEFEKYYNNQLVPQGQLLDALAKGTVDFALTSPALYSDLVPSSAFTSLPFWAESDEFAFYILNETEIGEILRQEIENYGAKIVMHGPTGEYGLFTNEDVDSVEDMSGLIARDGGREVNLWYEELGVSTANVSVAEEYEALNRGSIDATLNPYHNIETLNYHEVVDYMVRPPVVSSIYMVTYVSQESWNSLPEDLKQIIKDVSREMEQKSIEGASIFNANNDAVAEEYGVEVIEFPEEEEEKLFESAQKVWDEFAGESENNTKIIEILREELENNDEN